MPPVWPAFVHDFCHITASANKIFVMRRCGPCPMLPTQPTPLIGIGIGAHIVTFFGPLNEVLSIMLSVQNMNCLCFVFI